MVKNIIVACCDDEVKKIVVGNASAIFGEKQVYICKNYNDMYEKARYTQNAAIIFDKYFLGYVISYALTRLKILNKTLRCYFVEIGECSRYFGLRVYGLGTDGFITDIEKDSVWKNNSVKLHEGTRTFPEPVLKSIREKDYILDKKSITEVTSTEMEIGMYLGMGKNQKEICYLTGLSKTSVYVYVHRLKRKIGYKQPADYNLLNQQVLCCKEEKNFDS